MSCGKAGSGQRFMARRLHYDSALTETASELSGLEEKRPRRVAAGDPIRGWLAMSRICKLPSGTERRPAAPGQSHENALVRFAQVNKHSICRARLVRQNPFPHPRLTRAGFLLIKFDIRKLAIRIWIAPMVKEISETSRA